MNLVRPAVCRALLAAGCLVGIAGADLGVVWDNLAFVYNDDLARTYRIPHVWERLQLTAVHDGGARVGFQSSLGYAGYFYGSRRDRVELHHASFDWEDSRRIAHLRLGRQYVYDLIDPAGLDGFRGRWNIGKYVSVVGVAGVRTPEPTTRRFVGIHADSTVGLVGGRFQVTPGPKTQAGVAYQVSIGNTAVPVNALGLDLLQRFGDRVRFTGLFAYGIGDNTVDQYTAALTVSPVSTFDLTARGGYQGRPAHTVFAVDSLLWRARHEAGGGVSWQPTRRTRVDADYLVHILPGDEIGHRIHVGGGAGPLSLGYTHRVGGGGDGYEVEGSVEFLDLSKLSAGVSAGYLAYRIPTVDRLDQALATSLDTRFVPWRFLTICAEGMMLGNRYYAYDFRGLLRTTVMLARGGP